MRGGLDDALERLARRDELRRRAAADSNTPPAVTELAEAVAAVVARHPELAITMGVEGAGDPTLLRVAFEDGTVHVTAETPPGAVAPAEPPEVDFDLDVEEETPSWSTYDRAGFHPTDLDDAPPPPPAWEPVADDAGTPEPRFDQPAAFNPAFEKTREMRPPQHPGGYEGGAHRSDAAEREPAPAFTVADPPFSPAEPPPFSPPFSSAFSAAQAPFSPAEPPPFTAAERQPFTQAEPSPFTQAEPSPFTPAEPSPFIPAEPPPSPAEPPVSPAEPPRPFSPAPPFPSEEFVGFGPTLQESETVAFPRSVILPGGHPAPSPRPEPAAPQVAPPPVASAPPPAPPPAAPPVAPPAAPPPPVGVQPPPLAEPIPFTLDPGQTEQTEQAAKRLAALLREDPSLLQD